MVRERKIWLVTGSPTGFGRALAEVLVGKNERVIATARNPEKISNLVANVSDRCLRATRLDITHQEEISAAVELAFLIFKRIDAPVKTDFNGRPLSTLEQRIADDQISSGQFLDWTKAIAGKQPGNIQGHLDDALSVRKSNPLLQLLLGADAWDAIYTKKELM